MRRAARRLAESVGVVTRTTRRCASHRATPAWTSSSSAGLPRTAPASDLPIFSSAFAVARHARAYASLRKEVTRDGNVRWVRLAGSGDGERGGGDARRDSTRSRPPNRTPSDPETNRQRALNARVSKAPDAIAALREFAEAHRAFPNGVNDVNVAALFVALARSTRLRRAATPSRVAATASKKDAVFERVDEETTLFARAALASLLARLRELAPTATGRVCANVLHALGQLEARDWWTRVAARGGDAGAFEDAAASVARRAAVAEVAHSMNAQELANTYNGVSRLGAFAAASVTHQGWVTLSDALVARIRASEESDDGARIDSRKNVDFAALAAVLALNALASDKTRAAAEATSQDAFDALIRVAARAKRVGEPGARAVDTLSEQGLANVLNACAKLEKARLAVERLDPGRGPGDASRGWRLFTSRVASLAPRAGDQGLSVALHALTLCGDDARASVDEGGWRAFETAALRLAPTASPQAAAMLLNGAWKLAAEPAATRNGFSFGDVVLEALGRRAAEILVEEASSSSSSCLTTSFDEQATFVAADALGKLPAARAGFSAVAAATTRRRTDPWAALAGRLAARVVEAGRGEVRPSHSDATHQSTESNANSGGGPAASFHVLARVPELAGALVTKKAWRDVGSAIAKLASGQSFDAEDCARVLNGYAKQRRNALVAEATPPSAPRALARRVAALAADGDVDAMHVATIADALKKLPEARGEFERLARLSMADETGPARNGTRNGADGGDELLKKRRNPWDDLARVVAASAADLEPLQVTNVVSALGWLEPLASALARREGGWRAVLAAAGNRAASIKRGANESEAASAPDFSEAPEARKWLEKTSAGLELVRGHAGYQKSYGDEADRERLTALEAEFRDALKRVPS